MSFNREQHRVSYNRRTRTILWSLSKPAAELLERSGIALAWWATVDYYRTTNRSPNEAAEAILALYEKEVRE